jgi:hypothetical protein
MSGAIGTQVSPLLEVGLEGENKEGGQWNWALQEE